MTYCEYVFELHTDASSEELKTALRSIWAGPGRNHCILAKESTRLCVFSTHRMESGDGAHLEKVLGYLRTRASNDEVWYIRDVESWRFGAPIGSSISITTLVHGIKNSGKDGCRHPVAV